MSHIRKPYLALGAVFLVGFLVANMAKLHFIGEGLRSHDLIALTTIAFVCKVASLIFVAMAIGLGRRPR